MSEHRLSRRLQGYWNTLRKDEPTPRFAKFNPSAISDIWPNCVLFSVQPTTKNRAPVLSFSEIGENLRTIYSNDMLGLTFSAAQRQFQGAKIIHRVQEVIEHRQQLFDEGHFVNENNKVVRFRSCLMPFCDKHGRITHVVIGLGWREY